MSCHLTYNFVLYCVDLALCTVWIWLYVLCGTTGLTVDQHQLAFLCDMNCLYVTWNWLCILSKVNFYVVACEGVQIDACAC